MVCVSVRDCPRLIWLPPMIVHAQHGLTPLMVACHGGHVECVTDLLERGVEVNALAKVGRDASVV